MTGPRVSLGLRALDEQELEIATAPQNERDGGLASSVYVETGGSVGQGVQCGPKAVEPRIMDVAGDVKPPSSRDPR